MTSLRRDVHDRPLPTHLLTVNCPYQLFLNFILHIDQGDCWALENGKTMLVLKIQTYIHVKYYIAWKRQFTHQNVIFRVMRMNRIYRVPFVLGQILSITSYIFPTGETWCCEANYQIKRGGRRSNFSDNVAFAGRMFTFQKRTLVNDVTVARHSYGSLPSVSAHWKLSLPKQWILF